MRLGVHLFDRMLFETFEIFLDFGNVVVCSRIAFLTSKYCPCIIFFISGDKRNHMGRDTGDRTIGEW